MRASKAALAFISWQFKNKLTPLGGQLCKPDAHTICPVLDYLKIDVIKPRMPVDCKKSNDSITGATYFIMTI